MNKIPLPPANSDTIHTGYYRFFKANGTPVPVYVTCVKKDTVYYRLVLLERNALGKGLWKDNIEFFRKNHVRMP